MNSVNLKLGLFLSKTIILDIHWHLLAVRRGIVSLFLEDLLRIISVILAEISVLQCFVVWIDGRWSITNFGLSVSVVIVVVVPGSITNLVILDLRVILIQLRLLCIQSQTLCFHIWLHSLFIRHGVLDLVLGHGLIGIRLRKLIGYARRGARNDQVITWLLLPTRLLILP